MQTNPVVEYSRTARAFHWLTAILFLVQFPIGYAIGLKLSTSSTLLSTHMVMGLAIFWIVVARALYRLFTTTPRPGSTLAPWHSLASRLIHIALYAMLLGIPVMGWLASDATGNHAALGWLAPPAILTPGTAKAALLLYWHGVMAFTLLGAIFVHIAIAMQGYLENDPQNTADPVPPAETMAPASLPS